LPVSVAEVVLMADRAPKPALVNARDLARYQSVDVGSSPIRLKSLWLGLLLAPGGWLVGELVGYYLAARSCEPGPAGIPLAGTTYPATVHIVFELAVAIVAAIGVAIALSSWRRVRDDRESDDRELNTSTAVGRARFMATTGLVVSALFLFGILLFGFSGFVVNACSQAL
jgi:hypothetical protein